MQLSKILQNIEYTLIKGNTETEISDVIYDSRKVTEGTVFVALKGYNVDGHKFIPQAVKSGASVVVISDNVDIPEDIQGVSLLPLLKGERPKDWRKSLYYHFYEYPAEHAVKRHYGVRTERYKLIHFYNDIDAWELYDLKKDPREMHNLFGKPGYEKITEKLKGELVKLQTQYDDPIESQLKK